MGNSRASDSGTSKQYGSHAFFYQPNDPKEAIGYHIVMNRLIVLIAALNIVLFISADDAKKPTIMLLPSDNWCVQRYFTQTFDNQGTIEKIPNYKRAFTEDTELPPVISKIGGVLTGMGYSLKDAEMEIKSRSETS